MSIILKFILFLIAGLLLMNGCRGNNERVDKRNDKVNTQEEQKKQSDTNLPVQKEPLKKSESPLKNNEEKINNPKEKNKPDKKEESEIIAYYFHPTARCQTCINIEAFSFEAVTEWQKNIKRKIIWKELDTDDSANTHYKEEFSLEFSSLVLAEYSGGSRIKWKNLADTWKYSNDKNTLIKYVKFELNSFIK